VNRTPRATQARLTCRPLSTDIGTGPALASILDDFGGCNWGKLLEVINDGEDLDDLQLTEYLQQDNPLLVVGGCKPGGLHRMAGANIPEGAATMEFRDFLELHMPDLNREVTVVESRTQEVLCMALSLSAARTCRHAACSDTFSRHMCELEFSNHRYQGKN
jgi:hypothetical protein